MIWPFTRKKKPASDAIVQAAVREAQAKLQAERRKEMAEKVIAEIDRALAKKFEKTYE